MAEVALRNVTKSFGPVTAVDDLSLVVHDGEFVVLLGPTGAGKTTTLRVAAGLERPERGSVLIGGADVTRVSPAERDVAFVFQHFSLYPQYTVFDNLAFPLRAPRHRMAEAEIARRVREVASMLGIETKLAQRGSTLSGGEMQRVAIGRALVRRPSVFLMDEPLSSLDAKLREAMRIELKRIQIDLGATILYVTHDQVEAMTLADRIGVLAEGRLVQIGPPREIYDRPATTYVARRLGSPQINLVPVGTLAVDRVPAGAATLGVRPEDIVLGRQGGNRVLAVERLGAETTVLVEVQGHTLRVLAAHGERIVPDQSVSVTALAGRVLFFDEGGRFIEAAREVTGPGRWRAHGS